MIIRKLAPNEFSQQFSPFILRYEKDKIAQPKCEKIQTNRESRIKKKSFLERIIFLQRYIKLYLKKLKRL